MAILTKNQLSASNASSFPDNTTGAITPQILRDFNTGVIDTLVDSLNTGSFAITTGSNDFTQANSFTSISASSFISASAFIGDGSKITGITASISMPISEEGVLLGNATQLNFSGSNISASVQAGIATISVTVNNLVTTSSFNAFTASTNTFTASQETKNATLATYTASVDTKFTTVGVSTASLNSFTSSQNTKNSTLETYTASVDSKFTTIGGLSASWDNTRLNLYTASQDTKNATLASYTGSNDTKWNTLGGQTGSFITESETGSFAILGASNTFTQANNFTSISASSFVSASAFVGDGSKLTNLPGQTPLTSLNSFTASQETKDNTLASVTSSLNTATASLFTSASLALTTASFSGNTLTFTKGNGTTFGVVIPDVSGSTGNFATTGSNTFNGNQTINGNVNITGSLTASGLFYPTTDGIAGQFITTNGTNTLSFDDVHAILEAVRYGESITIGDPLYVSGSNGNVPIVYKADAAITSKMPVIYVATSTAVANTNTTALTLGLITGVTTTGYPAGTTIYVAEGTAGWSASRPSGSASIVQALGIVTKEGPGGSGRGLVLNPGPATLPNIQTGYAWVGDGGNQPVAVATSSFLDAVPLTSLNSFTASQYVSNSFFATTGSNTFTGDQTLIDAAGNTITLSDISGSLMLVAKTFTSASAHISASAGNQVNLIFKNNDNTADTIISGSNNIFTNPAAPTTGFKRYLGNNNIALLSSATPQISGSMQFSPTINQNYFAAAITMRGPVSASLIQTNTNVLIGTINIGTSAILNAEKLTGQTSVGNNFVAGQLNLVANQSEIRNLTNVTQNNVNGTVTLNLSSSAVVMSQNTINDSNFTFTNQFSSGSLGFGQVGINQNTIAGSGNTLIATGSQTVASTSQASFNQNLLAGNTNTAFVNSSEARVSGTNIYHQLIATSLLGQRLIVTGSSNSNDTTSYGSAFVGRFNAVDGIRDKSSDIIFAVGTGTSTSNRKTGFLIDSGSNTFVEGTLNVSGSTTMTGSLILSSSNAIELQVIGNSVFTGSALGNVVSMSIAANTASMDLNLGNYFTLTLADTATTHISASNVQPGTSATLVITTGTNSSASLAPTMLQPSGSSYSATNGSAKKDILSIVAVASGVPFVVSTKNMI